MTVEITAMQCPMIQKEVLRSMKAYFRDRVALATGSKDSQYQTSGLLPVYAKLVQCFNRQIKQNEMSQVKPVLEVTQLLKAYSKMIMTKPTTTTMPPQTSQEPVESADTEIPIQDTTPEELSKPVGEERDRIHAPTEPEHAIPLWGVIKAGIHKFANFVNRQKRDLIPVIEKNEDDETAKKLIAAKVAKQSKLIATQKSQSIFSQMMDSMIKITTQTCLPERLSPDQL